MNPPTGDYIQMPGDWRLSGESPSRRLIRYNSSGVACVWLYENDGVGSGLNEFHKKLAELQERARQDAINELAEEREAQLIAEREAEEREQDRRKREQAAATVRAIDREREAEESDLVKKAREAYPEAFEQAEEKHYVRKRGVMGMKYGPFDTAMDAGIAASLLLEHSGGDIWEAFTVRTVITETVL